MSGTRHPVSQAARERLREAQRRETQALTAVEKAAARRDQAIARLAAAQVAPQRRLDEAALELIRARASLADVSGVDRAATLLGESPAQVRAAIRAASKASCPSQEARDPKAPPHACKPPDQLPAEIGEAVPASGEQDAQLR